MAKSEVEIKVDLTQLKRTAEALRTFGEKLEQITHELIVALNDIGKGQE